ncbi:hypothetical protein [Polluticoccus soli]|uniref:hypothetical protein n=1 Tax=Polluticoccus soli TaxID=3034150 RepID=UPI0023E1F8D6|nr:hypothetical protein [Flavipsychrobacter sp. JY13-12]
MRYPVYCLVLLILSCKGKNKNADDAAAPKTSHDHSIECQAQRDLAISDHNSGSMKYYFYGIAYPAKEAVRKLKELEITPVVKDCEPEKAGLCYNGFIDSIMFAEYRVLIPEIK